MGVKGFIAIVVCVFSVLASSSGLAARGGNKGSSALGSVPVVIDGNAQVIGEVFSIDRSSDPAVLVAIDITDPNGLARKGIVGVIYDQFTSPDRKDVLYFFGASCQGTAQADLANVGLNLQMVVDAIYVVGDSFYMLQEVYAPPGDISNALLLSSYLDSAGTCQPWVEGTSPVPVGGLEPAFLVEEYIYQKYPLYFQISYR